MVFYRSFQELRRRRLQTTISNDSKILDRRELHTGRVHYYQIVHDTKNRRPIEPEQMERDRIRQHCGKIDIINHCVSTHTTPLHIRNGQTMRITIRKGMCRCHLHTEEGATTTPQTRTRHACTVSRLSESVRFC